ncbi:MAG: hypothetical protein QOJ58_4886, partial [Alphaproteobacteria bacterium]|nr:hypothetical protein [Alphaproteobacteria bacterium]
GLRADLVRGAVIDAQRSHGRKGGICDLTLMVTR